MLPTADDHALASRLAAETGRLLVTLRQRLVAEGSSHWDLKDAGDDAAHRLIVETLSAERPDDAVLSEEGADDQARLAAPRIWIVDPLDGTREFAEPGRIDWAVHIALVIDSVAGCRCRCPARRGRGAVHGAPADPSHSSQ